MASPHDFGKWQFMEKGWYVHPVLGGICLESSMSAALVCADATARAGWYFWPRTIYSDKREWYGPFDSMHQAAEKAEGRAACQRRSSSSRSTARRPTRRSSAKRFRR